MSKTLIIDDEEEYTILIYALKTVQAAAARTLRYTPDSPLYRHQVDNNRKYLEAAQRILIKLKK
jgi:hypothetical protein